MDLNRRPSCARCAARVSVTWCNTHRRGFCHECATEHENESTRLEGSLLCFWTAALPLRLMDTGQGRLPFPQL
jgi:hypothetical protein